MLKNNIKIIVFSVIGLALLAGLYFLSRFNYLLFHSIIELSSIIIGVSIFIIVVNTLYLTRDGFLLFLGSAFLVSSLLDILHTLAYKGMNVFAGFDSNLPTQLWISSRYLQSISLLIAFFLISKKASQKFINTIIISYSLIFIGLVLTTFYFKIFPACFIEGIGLTRFKIISEYVIIAILISAIVVYTLKRKLFEKRFYVFLLISTIAFIASETCFTFYTDVYGFFNMLGHLFKVISFFYIYKLFIEMNLKSPLEILFKDLNSSNKDLKVIASIDNLTGLPNRYYLFKKMETQYEIAKRFNRDFSIITIDIDDFKKINDLLGHPAGDEALKALAVIMNDSMRDVDIKGRSGGDEFIICPIETNIIQALEITKKIKKKLQEGKNIFNYTVSFGISALKNNESLENIIYSSDQALLKSKRLGKNRITVI